MLAAMPESDLRGSRLDRLAAARLYFVCEGLPGGASPGPLLDATLAAGTGLVQLRETAPRCDEELIALSEPFRGVANAHKALFILNDRPDLVGATRADGVHVGQDDAPVAEARRIAGPDALIGLSTHSEEQIDAACSSTGGARPDQISVGPIWETPTKQGRPATGLGLIAYAAANATLPWFAIGGIDSSNIGEVVAAGATRAVVVRAIRDATDPAAATRDLRTALEATALSTAQ
jgi:thiamine-phosphate pyrophosphorylase